MSTPRRARCVTWIPSLSRISRKARMRFGDEVWKDSPQTGLYGIKLTWQLRSCSTLANSRASVTPSLTPPSKQYSNVTRRPVLCTYSRQVSMISVTLHLTILGMSCQRRLSVGAWRETAKVIYNFSCANLRIPGTKPTVLTVRCLMLIRNSSFRSRNAFIVDS